MAHCPNLRYVSICGAVSRSSGLAKWLPMPVLPQKPVKLLLRCEGF
ncbi:hypothetical protein IP90_00974 [Luteimonas cucumeris]|uniref:Uncharacterized protein n=1 Tax=Luteimonas cucumeris TaxID=985012 RepID=A0A562LB93_9GAMM|nr:hypothetical protein IP90_00974 [Luteimonas cucumeris]